MKAALYIRVSTQEQVENYSIESQKEKLEAYCKSRGWEIYDTYVDGGYSGANTDRPALQSMLQHLPDFDVVAVYRLDRLSRSQRDTLTLIEDHFLKNNVDFASLSETLDTSTPFGKAMIGILSVFAQLERETIAERMEMGQIKRAEEGLASMGGDYNPSGYIRKKGNLIVHPEEAEHIQELFNLYEKYHSITQVQKHFKKNGVAAWRFGRYCRILSNPLYCGYITFKGKRYRGLHKPIITEEQFNRVQLLLSRHPGKNAHKAKESLFSRMIVCSLCGEPYLSYHSKHPKTGKVYRYYICRARRFPSEYPHRCENKTWRVENIEKLVISELRKVVKERESAQSEENKKINYKQLIQKIDNKITRVLSLYVEGNIEKNALDKQMEKLNQDKEELIDKEIEQEQRKQISLFNVDLNQMAVDFSKYDFHEKRAAIEKLIETITIQGESIKIEWIF